MNKKDIENIAYILKDEPTKLAEMFYELDPRIEPATDSWKEFDKGREEDEKTSSEGWERIALKNGARIIFGDTLTFQIDGVKSPQLREQAQQEYIKEFGSRWTGGDILS